MSEQSTLGNFDAELAPLGRADLKIEELSIAVRSRSGVTNDVLRHVDRRTLHGRRVRDLYELISNRLGGADGLDELDQARVRACAELITLGETLRDQMLHGATSRFQARDLVRVENVASRALRSLGIGNLSPPRSPPKEGARAQPQPQPRE